MSYLSRDHYSAVVVGSGFGGAVAACRLAQAGIDVAVIERGRRWEPGEFPRDLGKLHTGWIWLHKHGIYDIREFADMLCVTAAGWGGGSLVYANVAMRPPPDVFERAWPAPYTRQALDPFYDLAADMLNVRPVPSTPAKTALVTGAHARLGYPAFRPNLAVSFEGPNACVNCGECDIGCNVGAKNTLDRNYLAVAEQAGAHVGLLTSVVSLERAAAGYRIHLHQHADGGTRRSITADRVFVCAGALGSTEILLRSRKAMPALPPSLGHGYSGNGDFLAFGHGTTDLISPGAGPTITTASLRTDGDEWFLIEDGGYSGSLAGLVHELSPFAGRAAGEHTVVLLAMGRDRADGRIELRGQRLHVQWPTPQNLSLYAAEQAACADVVSTLGGRAAPTPTWRYLRQPVSVHNLGGCRMSDDPTRGVVDTNAQVHGFPGLYVLDGAILPAATGVNPSATIAAVAERCIQEAIRSWLGKPDWAVPSAPPRATPEDLAFAAVGRPASWNYRRPVPSPNSIRFGETMRGTVGSDPAYVDLTVDVPDLSAFVADPLHAAVVSGTVHIRGVTGPAGARISGGVLHLLARTGEHASRPGPRGSWWSAASALPARRTMAYRLPFTDAEGGRWLLAGAKDVWPRHGLDVWAATTTLRVSLTGPGRSGDTGVLRLGVVDFARELRSMHATSAVTMARFLTFFAGRVTRAFLPFGPSQLPATSAGATDVEGVR